MEHPYALKENGIYKWHAGAPDDDSYKVAFKELFEKINTRLAKLFLDSITTKEVCDEKEPVNQKKVSGEYIADSYGKALVALAAERDDFVVLDADLAADCRLRDFEKQFPERFIAWRGRGFSRL